MDAFLSRLEASQSVRYKIRPNKLALLPGLRWEGSLRIISKEPNGDYAVEFDAVAPKADTQERYVFDRTVLTAKQLKDWTGWEETP